MTDFETPDYFSDKALAFDPYPFLDAMVSDRPVWREPHHGVVMVTGYDEALAVYHDPTTFSSRNAVTGPEPNFPVEIEGDDISDVIDKYGDDLAGSDQIPTFDPPKHTDHRALIMGLITPKRLKENEEFMWRLADRQLNEILPPGKCEFINDFCQPYTLLVVADLLGVPESDHAMLLELGGLNNTRLPGTLDQDHAYNFAGAMYDYFIAAIEARRLQPTDDVLTGMALAAYPDGTVPEPLDVARIASNLFGAGQETTVRMLSAALQRIGEDAELQQLLRDKRELIPNFVEETLRTEGPVKGDFRLARKSTTLAGLDIPAGTTVMILNGAASRDPRRFECPAEFRVDRANARQHLAFGHGIHTCPGAPLARSEGRISIERLLDRTADIKISEEAHGPADARRYEYIPTYMFRGLTELHLEYTPID
jgi:cytochrome P450